MKKPIYPLRYFMIYKDNMPPLMREVYKFNPNNMVPYKWLLAILGGIAGITINICYNKYFYE
jgi:hypothetical protein